MTDNEIVKALECCVWTRSLSDCLKSGCPARKREGCSYFLRTDDVFEGVIFVELIKDAIDLINRQKAEIERLKENLNIELKNYATEYDYKIKAEAVKEFAENAVKRVEKAKLKYQKLCKEQGEEMEEHMHIHFNGIIGIINNLLKEMVGDN